MTDVFMNEIFVGNAENPIEFIEKVKSSRREGNIPKNVNIYYHEGLDEIHIETSKGRTRRPLIVVDNGKSRFTPEVAEKLVKKEISWKDLVDKSIIEYVDSSEEENCFVCLDENELNNKHTHLEISPVTILGLITGMVPYSDYGSSSRLIRGSKIQKQSLGLYAANYLTRLDTDANVLHYPQSPLVKTFIHDVVDYSKHPSGQNFIIAIMTHEGYNMQDAIILNKASVERGLGRSTYYKPYSIEENRYSGGLMDEVGIPDEEVKGYRSEKDYKKLEEDGIAFTESNLEAEDVLVGRTSPPRFLGSLEEFSVAASTKRESSMALGEGNKGKVDFSVLTESEEGNRLVQIRLRQDRIPETGDKFASRHGQKGVIGILVPQEDMPYTENGIIPDLIFDPHGIPGRMTISHLLEALAGKLACLRGEAVDATAFDSTNEEQVRKQLLEHGFNDNGTETLYNGITGEKFKVRIYVGNIYYLRLKHMVANKLHARAAGKVQLLTRQPIEGRAMGGGLRVGEMEKDCLVAHGASLLLKERFDSDKTTFYVCNGCGMLGFYDNYRNKATCPRCGANVKVEPIEVSYAFNLFLDEMKSMGIYPRIFLEDKF